MTVELVMSIWVAFSNGERDVAKAETTPPSEKGKSKVANGCTPPHFAEALGRIRNTTWPMDSRPIAYVWLQASYFFLLQTYDGAIPKIIISSNFPHTVQWLSSRL
jgi:hypothetical protein